VLGDEPIFKQCLASTINQLFEPARRISNRREKQNARLAELTKCFPAAMNRTGMWLCRRQCDRMDEQALSGMVIYVRSPLREAIQPASALKPASLPPDWRESSMQAANLTAAADDRRCLATSNDERSMSEPAIVVELLSNCARNGPVACRIQEFSFDAAFLSFVPASDALG
jgi:hypothetical protein